LSSPDASYGTPIEELNRFSVDDLLKEIKTKILGRSANGLTDIQTIYNNMDENGTQLVDLDDFRWGLIDYGIQITKEDAA